MPLRLLAESIDERTRAITDSTPDWPCRRGCDACCRSLANPPLLTPPEWDLLREGLAALPPDTLSDIRARASAPRVCPLLDPASGACLVYHHRPIACRAYGFYVDRDKGLHCQIILDRLESGALSHVVWGNHTAIEQALDALGPARPWAAWLHSESAPPLHLAPSGRTLPDQA